MNSIRLPALLLLSALVLRAQTSTWIAPGPVSPPQDWYAPGNWDSGLVPNAPGAVAIFPGYTNAFEGMGLTTVPGAARALIGTGDVSLAELRWQVAGGSTQTGASVQIGRFETSLSTSATLRLHGAGLTQTSASPAPAGFIPAQVSVMNGVLEFNHTASAGSLNIFGIEQIAAAQYTNSTIWFRDQSTAANASITAGGALNFRDQASAGQSSITMHSQGNDGDAFLSFYGQAGAGNANITIRGHTNVYFAESGSAQNARFNFVSAAPSTGFRTLAFQNQSTAGAATFTVNDNLTIEFSEEASAGTGNFTLGDRTTVSFRDDSTAAQAVVTGRSNIGFFDNATADRSSLVAYHVFFRDASSAGRATLSPTSDLATSSIEFLDQSNAGEATIHLGKLGRVVFAGNANASAARVIAGSGAAEGLVIVRDNAGTAGLTITTLPGGTGRLDISGTNHSLVGFRAINGLVHVELGANSLVFRPVDNNPAVNLAGVIAGTGGLEWERPTVLTVTNPNNTYTGSTKLLAGELRLAGGRISGLEMSAGTRLTGEGSITGNLVNPGLVSPGASPGTLTISGNYTQGPGGMLTMELFSSSSYDRLVVGGSATLAGTLNVSFLNGEVPVGNASYDLLTSASRTGQFGTVILPTTGAALGTQLVYTPTGVNLQVTQNSFAGLAAGSPAGAALGAHLDATLPTATGDYRTLIGSLNMLGAPALATALDALAPDRYTVLAAQGHLTAVAHQAARDRRFATLRADPARGLDLFFEVGQRSTEFDTTTGLPAAEAKLGGGSVGGAWHQGGFAFGAALTQETGDADLDTLGSRAELESLTPAVFFQYAADRFFLNAAAAFSRDDYELRRRIVYPGSDLTATATPSGRRTDLALTAGYAVRAGHWSWAPQVGLLHSDWTMDDFTETGAPGANLALTGWSATSLRTRAGFEVGAPGRTFAPRLAVFWMHDTKDDRSFATAFAGAPGGSYAAPGRPAGRDIVQAALGFDWQLGRRAVLSATLAGAWGDDARLASDLSAGFRWRF